MATVVTASPGMGGPAAVRTMAGRTVGTAVS